MSLRSWLQVRIFALLRGAARSVNIGAVTRLLNRRVFLRGLGGACVSAPFLSSLAERAAKAQAQVAASPKRLFVLFTHYGLSLIHI